MKFAIVLAAICFLGVAFAAPTPASDAAAKPNAFADWQKAFQETLNNLLGGNKNKPKRELTWADFDGLKELKGYKGKRDAAAAPEKKLSTNVFADAAVAMQNAFKQAMDNALKQLNHASAAKPKFNFLKNPVLKNPNWNKKPATEAVEEVVEEVAVEDSTEATRVAREAEAAPAAAPEKKLSTNVFADAAVAMQNAFKQAMDNALKQLNKDGAVKAKFNFLKNPVLKNPNWNKKPAAETVVEEVVEEVAVEDSTEATRVAREAEVAPAAAAPAGQFSLKDFGKMVDDFYAQFQAPKKSA